MILELERKAELLDVDVKKLRGILIKEVGAKDLRNLFVIMGIYLLIDVFYPLFMIDVGFVNDDFLWIKFSLLASFILFTSMIFIYLYYMLKKNASSQG